MGSKKAAMGVAIKVGNQKRKPTEAMEYYALKIEDESGKNESWLLLTEPELMGRAIYTCGELASKMKRGRTYLCYREGIKHRTYFLKISRPINDEDSMDIIIKVNDGWITRAIKRALKNPEDTPKQSWISDILD